MRQSLGRAIKSKIVVFVTGFILLFSYTAVSAQTPPDPTTTRFEQRTTEDGLPVNEITAVTQDSQGFIWVGSQDGISRYDGYNFVTYKHDPNNANSLSNNDVSAIFEDQDGFIWIATIGGGVNKFDPQTEQFTHYQHDPQEPNSLGGNVIFSIFEDSRGELWFGGPPASGLNRFNTQTESFAHAFPQRVGGDFPGGAVWQIVEDDAGNLWMAADSALVKFDPVTNEFTPYQPSADERRLSAVVLAENGRIWVGGSSGFYQFDPRMEQFRAYPGVIDVKEMIEAQDGRIWMGTMRDGVYLFDPRTEQIDANYRHDPFDRFSLSGDNLTAVFQDEGGVIWLGTINAGLNIFDPRQTRFNRYQHSPTDENSIASNSVTAVAEYNDRLWLGTDGTLNEITGDGTIIHHPIADNSDIYAITPDHAGFIWLGLSDSQLIRFDPQTAVSEHFPLSDNPNRPGPPRQLIAIVEDDNGALWIAVSRDGLYRLDPQRQEITAYQSLTLEAQINPAGINALHKDSDGHIWIGYQDGILRRLNPDRETFTNYRPNPTDPETLPTGWIEAIYVDEAEIVWLVTRAGLVRFDPVTGLSRRYTDADGLPTSFLVGVLPDRGGDLWLSSKNGLSRFDPTQETFRNYKHTDGLQGDSFNRATTTRGEDGRLYFGGNDGLTTFYPEQIKDNQYNPALVLTDLRLFNESVPITEDGLLSQPIHLADQIILEHAQSVVSFDFAALSYAASTQNQYRYRLDGLETEWNEVGSERRFATYTNLPAGDYVFHVQGSNSDGVWSEDEISLAVTVMPYWWELSWVRITAVFILFAILFIIYRARIIVVERRNRQLEQLVTERSAELVERERQIAVMQEREHIGRELHDDLGQMIGYMSVQAQVAQDLLAQGQTDETKATLTQLVAASHEAQSSVRQTILGIRTDAQPPPDFFAALQQFLTDLRQQHGLDVQISLPDDLLVSPLAPEVETQLLRIIQEALTNVRKHAHVATAKLIFTVHANEVQIIIADSGDGFASLSVSPQKGEKQDLGGDDLPHFGLTIMQERAESVGGTVEIESTLGVGTQVIVRLPRLASITATETMQGVRVLLVDDHDLYREGLRNLLQTRGADVVGMAENGRVAQTLATELQPDLILMDVEMPICDGLEGTQKIKTDYPDIKIVMLTVAAEEEKLFEALRYGASGYLLKSLDSTLFFNMLADVMRGETVLSPAFASRILADFAQQEKSPPPDPQSPPPTLTARQREVLDLVAQNKTNKEIAIALHISERTVKYHIGQVLSRLQMQNRYELADYARRQK